MKRFLKVVLAVGAMALMGNVSGYAQKFGYINFAELIDVMPEMVEVRSNFDAFQKDLEEQYESMAVELNNKWNNFAKEQESLTDAVREMRGEEIQNLQNRLNQFEQNAGNVMQQEQARLMAPVIERAQEAIQKVSKENAFTAVFELTTQSLAYYDESTFINILPLVQAELGIQ